MNQKVGRNDPCPCGSGKKHKQCCLKLSSGRKPIKAKLLSGGKKETSSLMPDLLERTFGEAIASKDQEQIPPKSSEQENEKKS